MAYDFPEAAVLQVRWLDAYLASALLHGEGPDPQQGDTVQVEAETLRVCRVLWTAAGHCRGAVLLERPLPTEYLTPA
ncbi:hypothetical protein [Deinococcus maricopensis]|uniref:Uncharacterized protein n=1 Tax=Deinococcus maricopensis (strain DSM 21211 / LMG 22137 / NRRL B-23946 / LB-34) TaxID=709986 RepID=E8U492_DEIML|nr:hypothetical protein [Deinococcus maricopensis]ADV65929.1 hypothetical protein Deima_0266 [Deinococcus maricopensis DSM 21211]